MPELPDIELYLARIRERVVGERLEKLRIYSPFVLRSVGVAPGDIEGRKAVAVFRMGKRIVIEFECGSPPPGALPPAPCFLLIHLMIAGRLQWQSPAPPEKKALGRVLLAAFRFSSGELSLVETSTKKRAGVWLIKGREGLDEHRREGLDVFSATHAQFVERLHAQNRSLKRILADPHSFDGIGNAYSDEILFAARLSPLRLTRALTPEETSRLHEACRETLDFWAKRLLELYPGFPKPSDVTAFRPDFAVHGRYGQPCRVCGAPVQHIVYAENETNYCANCQNEGRLLADRSLSRLLRSDWPKTLEDMLEGRP
ncbi:MAG: DNA-formamidopyrimidine glycosylase family protein [Fimbriimonadales bacterium]